MSDHDETNRPIEWLTDQQTNWPHWPNYLTNGSDWFDNLTDWLAEEGDYGGTNRPIDRMINWLTDLLMDWSSIVESNEVKGDE